MIDDDSVWKMWNATVPLFPFQFQDSGWNCNFQSNFLSSKDLFNSINIMSAVNCWNIFITFIAGIVIAVARVEGREIWRNVQGYKCKWGEEFTRWKGGNFIQEFTWIFFCCCLWWWNGKDFLILSRQKLNKLDSVSCSFV